MEWYWWLLLWFVATLIFSGVTALHAKDHNAPVPRAFALAFAWPVTLPRLLYVELSEHLFPKCVKCAARLRAKAKYCPKCGVKQ